MLFANKKDVLVIQTVIYDNILILYENLTDLAAGMTLRLHLIEIYIYIY